MSEEKQYIDYSTVRDALVDARERRGDLSYEQTMALNHAMWASSSMRNGIETESAVHDELLAALLENEKLASNPEIAAKIAELIPTEPSDIRAILASKRVSMEDGDVEDVVTLVRQTVGYEG
tara:strand:+ start:153 stop:518 length:366 start_codon:yes stop_codon:yes gene_type:complete